MQALSHNFWASSYVSDVPAGRPAKRPRTFLGERIVSTRQQAGLSQTELAEKIKTTQRVISYWERVPVALRADQITALADALGVTSDFLLGKQSSKPRGGPIGKARRLFESISKLPRSQQEKIFSVLEMIVAQHSNGDGEKRAV